MRNNGERLSCSEDIDVVRLVRGLWQQRLLVILTTLLVLFVAIAYAFFATPIYQVKIFVQPPTQNDIAHLNYGRGGQSGLDMITVKDVYNVYVRNLQSESLRRDFFHKVYMPSLSAEERVGSQDNLYGRMNRLLVVAIPNKETPLRLSITVSSSVPAEAMFWASRYAQMAGEWTKLEVLKDVKADATIKANNLERQIAELRGSALKQREDQIAQLTEALNVAKSIDLEKPPIISGNLSAEVSAEMNGALTYMRGVRALEAEIGNLQKRKSDDPFTEGLRQRQLALESYRSLKIDPEVIETYRQDGGAESPDRPVSPKKFLVVLLGGLLGAALGLFLGVARYVWLGLERPIFSEG